MRVHVIHTAREAELCRFDEALVVVIDALRATTVMASALDAGAARIFTTLTVDDAFELKTKRPEAILCGEREGFAVPGFDYGNSPVEIGSIDLSGRDIVLTTTNGTRAVNAASSASILLAATLVNLDSVSQWIKEQKDIEHTIDSIYLVCSGTNDRYSIDDVYVAGRLIQLLEDIPLSLSDSANAARMLANRRADEIINPEICFHAAYLAEKGLYRDVEYLLSGDRLMSVPRFLDGYFYDAYMR